MSADKLKVGVLGAGFMGGSHARTLAGMQDVAVAAVCAIPVETAHKLVADQGLSAAKVYDNFDRMLAAERLDALYVCIPPFAHNGEVEKAAAKGIHVFLEKPIAFDSARARRMVEAVRAAGVVSQVGFHYRFRKAVRELKRLVDTGEAGAPTVFNGRYWCNVEGVGWWRDKTKSRGQIFEQLIHLYDLALYLFGEPAAVTGALDNLGHRAVAEYTVEDTSLGTLRFPNGAMAVVAGSNCAAPVHFFGDFGVVFTKACLDYRCTGQTWVQPDTATLYQGDRKQQFTEDEPPYLLETEDFIAAIRARRPTVTPIEHGLRAILAVEKVMASAEKGGAAVRF